MINDKKPTSKKKLTNNKGINANSHEIELESLASKISNDSEPHSPKVISVHHVREELKNVIETMGPNVFTDTENDETVTEYSYIEIPNTESDKKMKIQSTDEDSQMTTYNVSDLVEYPITKDTSIQTSNREYLCPNTYHNNFPQHHFCPHQRIQNENCPNNMLQERFLKQSYNFKRESRFSNWFRLKNKECSNCKNCELYTINIEQDKDDESPPRRLVFDLMEELPKAETKTIGTNTKHNSFQFYKPDSNIKIPLNKSTTNVNKSQMQETVTERVDIYYFDHGNSEYYRTTDSPPLIKTEYIAERTDYYTKKFWAEFFGTLNIGISFVISFFLQFLRFILQALLRPLTIGVVQLISDYFFKPCLAVTFNGIVQPPMIFLYNFATSVRDVCAPVADSMGYFIREISVMLKSIRLVQIDRQKACNSAKVGNTGNCGTE